MPSRDVRDTEAKDDRFTAEEVGFFFSALSAARQRFGHVTGAISREYAIGPRGPWMIGLIGRQTLSPNDLAKSFGIGRSLVTAELTQLQAAGLIAYARSATDRRQVDLSLTPRGGEVRERLARDLGALLDIRLAGYAKDQVMMAARLLDDFAEGQGPMAETA